MKKYPYQDSLTDAENVIYKDFEARADLFVKEYLKDYVPQNYSKSKVIHDCIWGDVVFYPWELQIMDSPLLQRLRRINQLGLALYIYPSAHQSRFEHSLGVVAASAKMIDTINSGMRQYFDNSFRIPDEHIFLVRMAALLHDVGHCFFSHLSESIYAKMPQFVELKNGFEIFQKAKEHEILGYIIINTPTFCEFFTKYIAYPNKSEMLSVSQLLHSIGRMIVGAYTEPYRNNELELVQPYYLTDIINSQFDADALDYLRRDSYATGLDIAYNLDRFLLKLRIIESNEVVNGTLILTQRLTVASSGVTIIEEMMYNKQMLTRYVYHHQKIMAADSIITDITNSLMAVGKLTHPCDFLYVRDENIYMLQYSGDFSLSLSKQIIGQSTDKTIADLAKRIAVRNLPKKALVLNQHTIKSINGKGCSTQDISDFIQSHMSNLRFSIYDRAVLLNEKYKLEYSFDLYDICAVVPKYSLAKDYSSVLILTNDSKLVPISSITDLNSIADSYANNTWNGYIFASTDILPLITVAAMQVLSDYGMEFDSNGIKQLKHSKAVLDLLNAID